MINYDPNWRTRELVSAEKAAELAKRWRPASPPSEFPFPIRPDTGARDLRKRDG